LCHVTLNLAETSVVKSRPSVPYGANLFCKALNMFHVYGEQEWCCVTDVTLNKRIRVCLLWQRRWIWRLQRQQVRVYTSFLLSFLLA